MHVDVAVLSTVQVTTISVRSCALQHCACTTALKLGRTRRTCRRTGRGLTTSPTHCRTSPSTDWAWPEDVANPLSHLTLDGLGVA